MSDFTGPGDVVKFVMQELQIKNPVLIGYDWGGAIALKLAIQNSKMFDKIIAFHPSFNEQEKDELRNIKLPTLIQWVKQDQFHPWNKFKILANKIPNVVIDLFEIKPFKVENSYGAYQNFSDKVIIPIVKFLTGQDLNLQPKQVFESIEQETINTKGKSVKSVHTLMMQNDLTIEQIDKITSKPDDVKRLIQEFQMLVQNNGFQDIIDSRLNKTHKNSEVYKKIISGIPLFETMDSLKNVEFLNKYDIWDFNLQKLKDMQQTPRYFIGKKILVQCNVKSIIIGSQDYIQIDQNQNNKNEQYVSHYGIITKIDLQNQEFNINNQFQKPFQEVFNLNQPHVFATDILNNLVFEDGLKFDYKSVNVKLKLFQICFALAPLIKKLDFQNNPLNIQLECVRTIRKQLDIITFNKGQEKIVETDRFKIDSIGKIALYGQGNCHGCSSVMAAFLYPFSEILGIDLKYRGGFSFSSNKEQICNNIERHQWLEFSCRPSMQTFVCDLWKEGVHNNQQFLTLPIDEAYTNTMYPNGKLIIGTKSKSIQQSDIIQS